MANVNRASLNTATVRQQWNLKQAIEGCQRHGIRAISPWRNQIADYGLVATAKHIRDASLSVPGVCGAGMFTAADPQSRRLMVENNLRAIEEAAALDAGCLILVVGGLPESSKDIHGARQQVVDAIAELLPHARAANVPLAIEPLHPMYAADRACINTLQQANDLCDTLGDGVGIALDVYHVWWDPRLKAEMMRTGKQRMLAFHLCDWLVPTRDMALDRGMMGDGVINLKQISSWMDKLGYEGFYDVEIFSAENWWKRSADEVLETLLQRMVNAV